MNSSFGSINIILNSLIKLFPPLIIYKVKGEYFIKVSPAYSYKLLTFLKRHSLTSYNQLRDITAVDNPERKFRFEVIYQLLSILFNNRLTIIIPVAEGFSVDSIKSLYSSADWYERETWDRFGIFFHNHSDLRRRLTDYGFKGHPLRKDFPVTGFVEVRYNDFRKRILYDKVNFAQQYRKFNINI